MTFQVFSHSNHSVILHFSTYKQINTVLDTVSPTEGLEINTLVTIIVVWALECTLAVHSHTLQTPGGGGFYK